MKTTIAITDIERRIRALSRLADQLQEDVFSGKLVNALMKDTGYLKKNICEREIYATASLLDQVGVDNSYTREYNIDWESIRPLGKVAVLFRDGDLHTVLSKAICSSFLAGNQTIIKLPATLKHSAPYLRQLLTNHLPGVELITEAGSDESFLYDCISSSEIKAVVVYADDKWILPFRNFCRRYNTKLIFDGPGKNPFIVLPDADVDRAVDDAVKCGLLNGGQSRFAAERFFIHDTIVNEFVEKLSGKLSTQDDETDPGPVISDHILDRMISQVIDAKHKGGKIVMGGRPVMTGQSGKLSFLPTIITDCTTDMHIVQDENFGPVFPVISFSSEAELLARVDQTRYGLYASIYGTASVSLSGYMDRNHRNVFFNSTIANAENTLSRIVDGGFRNSGFTWEWKGEHFIHREGRRVLVKELSLPLG